MKYLSALGVLVGGFLLHPPPKAVLTTMIWVVSRSHPAVSALVLLAVPYHPSQFIGTWNDSRHLGSNCPRIAPVYAPMVSGATGAEGGPSGVVEGLCHRS